MSKLDVSLQRSWDGNKLLGIRLLFTGKRIPEHSQPYEALYVWSVLPQPLAWFTANIGLHHIHHLASRIPFYRLPDVLRRWRELDQAISLTLVESLRCVTLALWDEESHKLVPFRAINTV